MGRVNSQTPLGPNSFLYVCPDISLIIWTAIMAGLNEALRLGITAPRTPPRSPRALRPGTGQPRPRHAPLSAYSVRRAIFYFIFLSLILVHEMLAPNQKTEANCSVYFCKLPKNSIYYRAVRDVAVCVLLKQNSCGKTVFETIRMWRQNIEDHI